MKQSKVTIQKIAEKLGCSTSTVSRALNDKPGISEKVKTEIRILAIEMGYAIKKKKKPSAQNKEINGISIIVTRDNFIDENFYRKIIREIEQILYKENIELNFSILERESDGDILSMLKKMCVEGVIVFGLVSYNSVAEVVFSGIPMVLVDVPKIHLKVDRITANQYLGCYEAVKHLLNNGHRRISFFGDPKFSDNIADRLKGCKDCVEKNGGEWIDAENIVSIDMSCKVSFDKKKLKELLSLPNRPTAVVCANDSTAFELYKCLEEMEMSVPDDLSVIGFDNVDMCQQVNPPLTSINVPKFEMGQEAVKMLLERIAEPKKVTALLRLDTDLIVRNSVKKIN